MNINTFSPNVANIIKKFLCIGEKDYHIGLYNIVCLMKKDLDKYLYGVVESGNTKLLKRLLNKIEKSASIFARMFNNVFDIYVLNHLLYSACAKNNLEMVKLFIEKGANNLNAATRIACVNGSLEVAKYLKSIVQTNKNHFYASCEGDNAELVKITAPTEISYLNEGLKIASRFSTIDVINLIIKLGANDFNTAIEYACGGEKIENVKFLASIMNFKVNNCMKDAHNFEIVKFLIELGANDFVRCLQNANIYGRFDTIEYVMPHVEMHEKYKVVLRACATSAINSNNMKLAKNIIDKYFE